MPRFSDRRRNRRKYARDVVVWYIVYKNLLRHL
jgi:hypothetical protein